MLYVFGLNNDNIWTINLQKLWNEKHSEALILFYLSSMHQNLAKHL